MITFFFAFCVSPVLVQESDLIMAETKTWQDLKAHWEQVSNINMRELFAQDPTRFDQFHVRYQVSTIAKGWNTKRCTNTNRTSY